MRSMSALSSFLLLPLNIPEQCRKFSLTSSSLIVQVRKVVEVLSAESNQSRGSINLLAHLTKLQLSVLVGVEDPQQSFGVLVELILVDGVRLARLPIRLAAVEKVAKEVAQLIRVDESACICVVFRPDLSPQSEPG